MSIQTLKLSCSVSNFSPTNGLKSDPYCFLTGTYISTLFTVCFGRLYFVQRYGAAPVELQISLGDAVV